MMCAIGGWQLAAVLGEGDGSGNASGPALSSAAYEWNGRCNKVAKTAFGHGPVGPARMKSGLLKLREQGCNPDRAPSGVIPMVTEPGSRKRDDNSGNSQSNDWGGGKPGNAAADGWGS